MRMATGDLEPDLEVTLYGVDATTASSIRVLGRRADNDIIFDRAPTTTTLVGSDTKVTMAWVDGDTDDRGRIQIEVEVTWPGVRPQTFRPDGGVDLYTDFDLADIP
jgi:hypothetical protein